jgi:hypothetical protein
LQSFTSQLLDRLAIAHRHDAPTAKVLHQLAHLPGERRHIMGIVFEYLHTDRFPVSIVQ